VAAIVNDHLLQHVSVSPRDLRPWYAWAPRMRWRSSTTRSSPGSPRRRPGAPGVRPDLTGRQRSGRADRRWRRADDGQWSAAALHGGTFNANTTSVAAGWPCSTRGPDAYAHRAVRGRDYPGRRRPRVTAAAHIRGCVFNTAFTTTCDPHGGRLRLPTPRSRPVPLGPGRGVRPTARGTGSYPRRTTTRWSMRRRGGGRRARSTASPDGRLCTCPAVPGVVLCATVIVAPPARVRGGPPRRPLAHVDAPALGGRWWNRRSRSRWLLGPRPGLTFAWRLRP
jgi:hypothetical protein